MIGATGMGDPVSYEISLTPRHPLLRGVILRPEAESQWNVCLLSVTFPV